MTTATATPPEPAAEVPAKKKGFGEAYWMLNAIEMFERLAYFGIRSVVPIYIMQATEPGGLQLTALHKGWIYAWWAAFQSLLPTFTGGYADRYGYKRVLVFAISMNVIGYVMMAYLHSYYGFFAGILVLATGTAFFKPSLQGSLAQNLTKDNSSLGWGIFYWVVNVGAFGAPFLATIILGKPHSAEGWRNLFLASAGYTSLNLLLLLTFKDVPSGASKTENPLQVLWKTIRNIVEPRLITWLLIMSCFWLMMYQLWDLHPNFIEDWVDSSMVAKYAPFDAWREYGDRGLIRVPQQILLNLNAGMIILCILPIAWMVRKMRTLSAMLIGMSIATGGILVAGLTGNGWVLLLGIVFFSLGEMLTGPKKNEYLGLIAPPGKKGLYLGYVNIPVGIGVFVGSLVAGFVYDNFGEKATLALKYLGSHTQIVARAAKSADWSDSLQKIPALIQIDRGAAFELASRQLRRDHEATAAFLRDSFRRDRGQITNLALQYLALHPDFKESATSALGKMLSKVKDDEALNRLGAQIQSGQTTVEQIRLARFVHLLPEALEVGRPQVFEIVRDRVNKELPADQIRQEAQIIERLWERFGADDENLNNLALEYLAQGTDLIYDAAARMTFDDPVAEIERRMGIGRTKSFAALAAALGADRTEVDAALSGFQTAAAGPAGSAHAFLAGRPQHRFLAIAKKDWSRDVTFLRQMVESDERALRTVAAEIDHMGWWEKIVGLVRRTFTSEKGTGRPRQEGIDYQRLAGKQDLIQKALAAKDWSRAPDQAAALLGLNPFEARALVAAEVAGSPVLATQLLWDTYHPQYFVWIPFAAIGVMAAIALAIFGQMAKRWKDMNA